MRLDSLKDVKGLKARCTGDGGEILERMGAARVIIMITVVLCTVFPGIITWLPERMIGSAF